MPAINLAFAVVSIPRLDVCSKVDKEATMIFLFDGYRTFIYHLISGLLIFLGLDC